MALEGIYLNLKSLLLGNELRDTGLDNTGTYCCPQQRSGILFHHIHSFNSHSLAPALCQALRRSVGEAVNSRN